MRVVLAFDIGGTSFRAGLVDETGEILAQHLAAGPMPQERRDAAGHTWSEIDPDDWWLRFRDAAASLAESEPAAFRAVEGVAGCGVTRTQVFLGADGSSLRPAITWRDTRAEATLHDLLHKLPADHPEHRNVNAFHPLARLHWLAHEDEASQRKLVSVADPKDYIVSQLTGGLASDRISMARLLACAGSGPNGRDLFAAAGFPAAVPPRLLPPEGRVGRILPGLGGPLEALAGRPVFCGCNDTWTAVVGLGAMEPGMAYNISGTTEVFGVLSVEPAEAEGLLTVDWSEAQQLGGPGQNGADTVRWLLGLLARPDSLDPGHALAAMMSRQRQAQPLLFLPYLQGERTPYWDAGLRGAFVGLHRNHADVDLAFAVLEGVAFHNRIILERAEAATGGSVREIRFGGGAARNAVWRQIKADICGRPIVSGRSDEPGLLGAAALAWTGLGRFASLSEAQLALARPAAVCLPDPGRREFYDELYVQFRAAEAAVAPVSRALATMGGRGVLHGVADRGLA